MRMSIFNMLPREGHLKALERILSYLNTFPEGRVIIDTSYPDHSLYPVEDQSNWMEFYLDASVKRFQRIFLLKKGQGSGWLFM
jgi:hypothetical protein